MKLSPLAGELEQPASSIAGVGQATVKLRDTETRRMGRLP